MSLYGWGKVQKYRAFVPTDVDGLSAEHEEGSAEQHQLPRPVLDHYLELLKIRQTSSSEQDASLREMSKQFFALQKRLKKLPAADSLVKKLHDHCRRALNEAEFQRVETMLNYASNQAVRIANEASWENSGTHFLSAAESKAAAGEIKYNEMAYLESGGRISGMSMPVTRNPSFTSSRRMMDATASMPPPTEKQTARTGM